MTGRRRGPCGALAAIGCLLAACSTPPPAPPDSMPMVLDSVVALPRQDLTPTQLYERRLRARANEQFTQGRLADAALSWEILSTLRPQEADYARHLQETLKLIDAALSLALQRAAQLQKKGDLDGAANQYLSALALRPEQAEAAAGLRTIERERIKRGLAIRTARMGPSPPPLPAALMAATPSMTPADRNDLEHASILAVLGEVDAAIGLLERRLALNKADLPACQQLADVYLQKAQSLTRSDKAAALAMLEKSLRLDGRNPRALARLPQLKPGAAAVGRSAGICPRQR